MFFGNILIGRDLLKMDLYKSMKKHIITSFVKSEEICLLQGQNIRIKKLSHNSSYDLLVSDPGVRCELDWIFVVARSIEKGGDWFS